MLGEAAPIELANTRYASREGSAGDALRTAEDLAMWLGRVAERLPAGLAAAAAGNVRDDDVVRARALRKAIRSLLGSAAGYGPLDATAATAVNAASSAGPGWLELDARDGVPAALVRRFSASPMAAVLSVVAQEAVELLAAGAAVRACATPGCVLFFVREHPRRTSCSPACSNRARAARHYERHRHA